MGRGSLVFTQFPGCGPDLRKNAVSGGEAPSWESCGISQSIPRAPSAPLQTFKIRLTFSPPLMLPSGGG